MTDTVTFAYSLAVDCGHAHPFSMPRSDDHLQQLQCLRKTGAGIEVNDFMTAPAYDGMNRMKQSHVRTHRWLLLRLLQTDGPRKGWSEVAKRGAGSF